MTDFVVLGTDTDAGKTTFALLWLALRSEPNAYWKPVESGDSDTARVQQLIPGVVTYPPLVRCAAAVAPPLAARREGTTIPLAAALVQARPEAIPGQQVLVETFGSPFSPLNETELQIRFLQALALPSVLVSSARLGAIGRTLQTLQALAIQGLRPAVVVLLGPRDEYAVEQIVRHGEGVPVFALEPPQSWDVDGIARAAREQDKVLFEITACLAPSPSEEERESTAAWRAADQRLIWHPYTSLRDADPPLVCVAAEKEFLTLADGRRIIDGISSWWTILHGHRHPVLLAALRDALTHYDHVHFAGVTHPPAIELAELLLATAPWSDGRVFYSDNGSTAVEVALKMAYQYWCQRGEPQRTLFVGLEHAYHGDTFGAMAVGRDPLFFGCFEPLLFRAVQVPMSPEQLDQTLSRHAGQVAAVLVEPLVQGAGGMRMHTPETLRDLWTVARRHDVLFIVDEVMTGLGRTGTFWAHTAAGIAPDLICTAKTLAGGMISLAATLAAPRIVAAWDTDDRSRTFFHGHSFTAHPLACAVAATNLRYIQSRPNPAGRIEAFWRASLGSLNELAAVEEVRIRGSIAAIELAASGGYLADVGRTLRRHCLDDGVLLRPLGNVLYALPPLETTEESLQRIARSIQRAVEMIQ